MKAKSSFKESAMRIVFLVAACVSVLAVALICIFLFANGIPAMKEIGFLDFLIGDTWRPSNDLYGILPFILGSIYVTAGAIIVGVPIAILTSVFMAYYCPKKLYGPLKAGINLMAGVPSVVYGFFGLVVLVPLVQDVFHLASGKTMLTASLMLAIMILPTVVGVIEPAPEERAEKLLRRSSGTGRLPLQKCIFYRRSRCQIRYYGRNGSGYRPCYRRNHGRDHDRRKSDGHAQRASGRRPDHDFQYRAGDGIRVRTSQRVSDCHRCGAVRVYPDHQPLSVTAEQEGRS